MRYITLTFIIGVTGCTNTITNEATVCMSGTIERYIAQAPDGRFDITCKTGD